MPYLKPHEAPKLSELFTLKGRNVLIVGGSGLLGSEISFAFAEMGANICIANRNQEKTNEFINTLKLSFPTAVVHGIETDITSAASLESLTNELGEVFEGKLHSLVNCGWSGRKNSLDSITLEDWGNDIEVSLNGVFKTIHSTLPYLRNTKGNILNIASMYGHIAPDYRLYDGDKFANPPSYGAAKAGVIQLTRYLASFLSKDGIRANCISPGPFPFDETQMASPEFIKRLESKTPAGRIGNPHELKGVAALLCSDAGSYINGQNISVDGGWGIW